MPEIFKKLGEFFDYDRFMRGKTVEVDGIEPWKDFNTKEILGTKVKGIITRDDTVYRSAKPDEQVSNKYKHLVYKVPQKDFRVPLGSIIKPVNPVVTVYGQYHNQLSIKADDIQVINPQQGAKQ